MHDRLAAFTEGLQVSRSCGHSHVLGPAERGPAWFPTAKAVEPPRPTRLLPFAVPLLEKPADDRAVKDDRSQTVDWIEPCFPPVQNGVLVYTTTGCELGGVVGPIELYDVRVDPAFSHWGHLALSIDQTAYRGRLDERPTAELEDLKSTVANHRVD